MVWVVSAVPMVAVATNAELDASQIKMERPIAVRLQLRSCVLVKLVFRRILSVVKMGTM